MLNGNTVSRARLSDDYKYIIDSRGNRLNYDDPNVVHVWPVEANPYVTKMAGHYYTKRGWNFRFSGAVTQQSLQKAKKLSSGRECFTFNAVAGGIYSDVLEKRKAGEFSLYYFLNMEHPCQFGAWENVWGLFSDKLDIKDALFMVWPDISNNYIGQGLSYGQNAAINTILGDIFVEAELSLKTLAVDVGKAMEIFTKETEKVMGIFKTISGLSLANHVKRAMKEWAGQLSRIPLHSAYEEKPRVFIFGGTEVGLLYHPITKYFIAQGIIPKVLGFSDSIYLLTAAPLNRYLLKRKKVSAKEQFSYLSVTLSLYNPWGMRKETLKVFYATLIAWRIDYLRKQLNQIAQQSGLINRHYISLQEAAAAGAENASANSYAETFSVVGNYLTSCKPGAFNGLLLLHTFGCQPVVNAQAIIRPLAVQNEIPYASIDMEGPWISASQMRTLETLAVQAKRHHRDASVPVRKTA